MSTTRLEVLSSPAEFRALTPERLRDTTCVVIDVLRATTSMITALGHGAAGILPVSELHEALDAHRQMPDALLAGERGGLRIDGPQTGGVEFDYGNSPGEFANDWIRGRSLIWTTTNGTRALRSAVGATRVFACSFLNMEATTNLLRRIQPTGLLVIGAGTHEESALEDTLAAGAVCHAVWNDFNTSQIADSARIALELFLHAKKDLASAIGQSRNGRRLLSIPDLAGDVVFAARCDTTPIVAELGSDGWLRSG